MMKMMIETQLEALSNPKTADELASFTKNYYNALIKKGFSKQEALNIATKVGFPTFPGMMK
jgi:hypothetical protein